MKPVFQDQGYFRRKFPRRTFERKVGVLCRGAYFVARGGEIGEGGMSLQSDMVLSENSLLLISLQVPGAQMAFVKASVRTQKRTEDGEAFIYGLSFENVAFSLKREIRLYVSSNKGRGS